MAFRNPLTSLPASAITGEIGGSQLAADAIDGKVITGATIQTAHDGRRLVLTPGGALEIYSGGSGETPGSLEAELSGEGADRAGVLKLAAPRAFPGEEEVALELYSLPGGNRRSVLGNLSSRVEWNEGGSLAFSGAAVEGALQVSGDVTVNGEIRVLDGVSIDGSIAISAGAWTNLALRTGFSHGTAGDPAQWRSLTLFGERFVQFRGRVIHAGLTSDTVFATLGSMKPVAPRRFSVARTIMGTVTSTRVDWTEASGDMTVYATATAPLTFLSLDGVMVSTTA